MDRPPAQHPPTPQPAPEGDEYTVDELARRVSLPSSTIRLYQNRRLIPPPRRHGRSAFYGPGHISRIELIGRLQDRGFSLAAIGELVAGWEAGRGLEDVLGLDQTIPGGDHGGGLRTTVADLAARFPGSDISPEVMGQVIELGLVELDGDAVVVKRPAFLEVGSALVALGFPLSDVLDEAVALQHTTNGIADRFAALFVRHVWRPFAAAGMPPDRLAEVAGVLEQLAPLAERVVISALRQSLAESADQLLATEAGERA